MSRYASEGSGRYDHLHGDEDEIAASRPERVSSCSECGSTDGCMCSVRPDDDVPQDFIELTMRASEKLQQARNCYRDSVAEQTKARLAYLREAADIISSARDLA